MKKCDRESARRRTDTQTNRQTHTQTQTDFIICPMLYAIAMGQIKMLQALRLHFFTLLYANKHVH